jgi:hypothetical protein
MQCMPEYETVTRWRAVLLSGASLLVLAFLHPPCAKGTTELEGTAFGGTEAGYRGGSVWQFTLTRFTRRHRPRQEVPPVTLPTLAPPCPAVLR